MTTQIPSASKANNENPIIQEWWVQRWVDLLNAYRFKKRLERGRVYAREGNILHLEFRHGKVQAKVQGTAPEPYTLTISIEQFSHEDWKFVITTMAEKAIYAAKLLAGTMPDDIETVFTSNGLSLFPFTLADVRSRCNCPDPQNPCKHIAAVYYQLGDFFREDPFVLFQLRGRTKAEILEAIRHQRGITTSKTSFVDKPEQNTLNASPNANAAVQNDKNIPAGTGKKIFEETSTPDQALSSDTPPRKKTELPLTELLTNAQNFNSTNFCQYDSPLDSSLVVITPPTSSQTVLDVLGKLPLTPNDAQTVRQHLDDVYKSVSQQAMITALNRNG